MTFLGLHISYWLLAVGLVGYAVNNLIVSHYIKVKKVQIAEEQRMERRRTSEKRKVKNKQMDKILTTEVPKLKWTVPFGVTMMLMMVVGGVWTIIDFVMRLINRGV